MKTTLLILFSLLLLSFSTEEKGILISEYNLDLSILDSTLQMNEAIFKFTFKGVTDRENDITVKYSCNGQEKKVKLNEKSFFELKVKPGKYKFQFYLNDEYFEIYTDSLIIKSQYRDDYSVYFQDATHPYIVDKPVIYLYPEKEIDVDVKLTIHGQKPFFYPAYDDGWRIKASPDGTLNHYGSIYNYLFWEAEYLNKLKLSEQANGYIVSSENSVGFLENILREFGLNTKEQADFITYWAPRLIKNDHNFIHFEINDACNKFAELDINPKPDNIYRLYIFWSPVSDVKDFPYLRPQEIQSINRLGFTVLEWGGAELQENWKIENSVEL